MKTMGILELRDKKLPLKVQEAKVIEVTHYGDPAFYLVSVREYAKYEKYKALAKNKGKD